MERMQIIQDVSDRLLYLPDDELVEFVDHLKTLFSAYCIDCEDVDGVRIIKKNRYENKRTDPNND